MVSLKKPDNRRSPGRDMQLLAAFEAQSQPGNEVWVMDQVAGLLKPLHIATETMARIKTAVAEASMNAMEHGNRFASDRPIQVAVLVSKNQICIQVTDQGGASDFPDVEIPDLDAKLAGKQSPRGWGIFLIKNMVDELKTITSGNLHTVELIFHRRGSGKTVQRDAI